MPDNWTFGRKLGACFAVVVLLAISSGAVATYALDAVVTAKDRVILGSAQLMLDAERLRTAMHWSRSRARAFVISGEPSALADYQEADRSFEEVFDRLEDRVTTEAERTQLARIATAHAAHQAAVLPVLELRRSATDVAAVGRAFDGSLGSRRDDLIAEIDAFATLEERNLGDAQEGASELASRASSIVIAIGVLVVVLALLLAAYLTRTLGRQIGTAVSQVQSSSAELQAAATQQATGAKEQVTAMREIGTTITELLATSRQIAESAQRVAEIAGTTAGGAREGEAIVVRSGESIQAIRRQVDLIVGHMLELGRKSQQIGGIADIVGELAEQTNILAINATIEAAGAGESGRRFAVVADEIRKLADRVAGSTKEIRGLIDDVRAAVNTTVMATETGSKAVDSGSAQFSEVTGALQRIASLVGTTTDAAREIHLSTKQQSTAVEQVNTAIANVSQATRETESSTAQTLQTAAQLASLSNELLRLVQPQGNG